MSRWSAIWMVTLLIGCQAGSQEKDIFRTISHLETAHTDVRLLEAQKAIERLEDSGIDANIRIALIRYYGAASLSPSEHDYDRAEYVDACREEASVSVGIKTPRRFKDGDCTRLGDEYVKAQEAALTKLHEENCRSLAAIDKKLVKDLDCDAILASGKPQVQK